jgi:MscS family membrane protein
LPYFIKTDVDPARAIRLMEDVVLAHPDTMGEIEQKLDVIDKYYGFSVPDLRGQQKREVGRKRLIAEQAVSVKLVEIEQALAQLAERLSRLEKNGLDAFFFTQGLGTKD